MADSHVRVNVLGAQTLFTKLRAGLKDFRKAFRDGIDPIVTAFFGKQFETRGSYGGKPWAPLSPRTIQGRTRQLKATRTKGVRTTSKRGRARAGFATPLRDTNRLWASLAKHTGPEVIKHFAPLSYDRGTTVPYAAHAQRAGPGRLVMPDPPPQFLTTAFESIVLAHLNDAAA